MWQKVRSSCLARHTHEEPYAALVLSGGYEEAGDQGRLCVEAGQIVFHGRFEAHLDRFSHSGAVILNLRMPKGRLYSPGVAHVADLDSILSAAERSRDHAIDLLISETIMVNPPLKDWPDQLAAELIHDPCLKLSQWANEKGLAPWTVSRGFLQVFGLTPEAFRARARARHAWKCIQCMDEPLAAVAAHCGFADQAHMTRAVRQLTGLSPRAWRAAANGFKTEEYSTI